jgi:hypothetical protein
MSAPAALKALEGMHALGRLGEPLADHAPARSTVSA